MKLTPNLPPQVFVPAMFRPAPAAGAAQPSLTPAWQRSGAGPLMAPMDVAPRNVELNLPARLESVAGTAELKARPSAYNRGFDLL